MIRITRYDALHEVVDCPDSEFVYVFVPTVLKRARGALTPYVPCIFYEPCFFGVPIVGECGGGTASSLWDMVKLKREEYFLHTLSDDITSVFTDGEHEVKTIYLSEYHTQLRNEIRYGWNYKRTHSVRTPQNYLMPNDSVRRFI